MAQREQFLMNEKEAMHMYIYIRRRNMAEKEKKIKVISRKNCAHTHSQPASQPCGSDSAKCSFCFLITCRVYSSTHSTTCQAYTIIYILSIYIVRAMPTTHCCIYVLLSSAPQYRTPIHQASHTYNIHWNEIVNEFLSMQSGRRLYGSRWENHIIHEKKSRESVERRTRMSWPIGFFFSLSQLMHRLESVWMHFRVFVYLVSGI